jgi:pilus assembly protein Flp/PilA
VSQLIPRSRELRFSVRLGPWSKGANDVVELHRWLNDFVTREDGPTAVEYAVMLALIIVVCIGAITTLGSNSNKTFTSVGSAINVSSS